MGTQRFTYLINLSVLAVFAQQRLIINTKDFPSNKPQYKLYNSLPTVMNEKI